jgi:TPR repeat protein/nucleoside-triphosphatase THEP1
MKTQVKPLVANLYNPHEQSKEQLIQSFVLRHDVFHKLFQDIKSSDRNNPEQHYLIEGQRGMGKTTLLLRLAYEIEHDPDLRNRVIPIVLKEEAYYGVRRLFRLWETIAQELEAKDKIFSGLAEHMNAAYETAGDYEQTCFEMLINALEGRAPKNIILFIDNLGEMIRNFSDQDNLRLREILTTCPYVRLIGATPVVFEALLPEYHVFYRFFNTIRLEGLNKDETHKLLLELAKAYHTEKTIRKILERHPGRIEALRILTGGVIRTIVLLFEIFIEREDADAVTDLDNILDRVTPLYQGHMRDLTPLQRDVVNAIALNWDAISPAEIARTTRLNTEEVSTVLSELEKVFIIQRVAVQAQQPFYLLQERFFNIWYLMRLAPGGSQSKVLWSLHFLESWYDQHELTEQARKYTKAIAAGRYTTETAYALTEAFVKTGQLDVETEHQMIGETKKLLQELDAALAEELPQSDKEVFEKAEESYRNEDYEQAIIHFLEVKHKNDQICFRLGDSFSQLARYNEAIEYFLKAIEAGNIDAMLHLGLLYHNPLKDYQNAEMYYVMAAEKGNTNAILALGNLYYSQLKDYKNAEKYYLMAVKEGQARSTVLTSRNFSLKTLRNYLVTVLKGEVKNPEQYQFKNFRGAKQDYLEVVKKTTAEAAFQLGNLYAKALKDPEKAEKYYVLASETGHVGAMLHFGFFYHYTVKDYEQAIKYYTMAVENGEEHYAAVNLGVLYQNALRDYKNAETYYLLAVKKGDAGAMNGLAWLYFEQKIKKQEALHYARQAREQETNIYTAHTLACIYLWNNDPEKAFQTAQEFMYDAESYKYLEHDILGYLMLLLAKKHYQYLNRYFRTPDLDLPERFKPLYYAFLYFTDDPNYYKLPPEFSEPVRDIIRQVEQLAVDYA